MLDKIDLNHTLSKKEYKTEIDVLKKRLAELQRKLLEFKIPAIIMFEGWSAAGKGTCISKILHPLDPRYYYVHTMNKIPENSAMRPFLWDYWIKMPPAGRIALFDKSWYRAILPDRREKRPLSESAIKGFYYDVDALERMLSENGMLIIRFFLHISKQEQKKRFDELLNNPDTHWRIDKHDMAQHKNYDEQLKHFDNMIRQSDSALNEWNIIEADDAKFATVKIYKILINKFEKEINLGKDCQLSAGTAITANEEKPVKNQPEEDDSRERCECSQTSILRSIEPDKEMPQDEYKEKLSYYQKKLAGLEHKLYIKRTPVVIVYEGWDAAGKGGNIRRLTRELDPRGFEWLPISAPSREELERHYLWRFWKAMPKDGHIAIFDRSWYGRVLVERVEGFCSEKEWRRAYQEINDMETHLYNHGTVIIKFWLHIDKEEQLRRFHARETDPYKQFKITEEDWRNREKWDDYEKAVDEMIFRTNKKHAPWIVVESNNKKYARVKTLEIVVDALEERLK